MTDDVLSAALAWREAGVSVIPIKSGGQKKPLIPWKNGEINFQQQIASEEQVREWFTGTDHGLAIICGAVSDNIEMFEIEGRVYDGKHEDERHRINEALRQAGVEDAFDYLLRSYREQTPSGGIHLIYYVQGGEVPGNMKIANEPAVDDAGKPISLTLVETRGEGGYVIVAPTGGHCHSSGRPWSLLAGRSGSLPSIDVATRDRIHGAFHAVFDKTIEMPVAPRRELDRDTGAVGDRPGDQWAAQIRWREVLEPEGWEFSHSHGDSTFWTRPGKDRRQGISAATREDGNLYVWSSSAGLPTEQPLSKMFVHAHYRFNGDMSALAADLRRQSFGVDRPMEIDLYAQHMPLKAPERIPIVEDLDDRGWGIDSNGIRATPASAFKMKRVRWLWEDWVPLGAVTIITGREGVGKSLLLAALAADITRGRLSGEFHGQPRPVFYVASEDSWEYTIVPRMTAAGADLDLIIRIDVVNVEGRRNGSAPVLPIDCDAIGDRARLMHPAALMLDPIVSLVGDGYDTYKATDVRKVLEPLTDMANKTDLNVLALAHQNKSQGVDTSSKIAGSRAWIEVPRSGIAIARMAQEDQDESDPELFFRERENRVAVSLIKNNLGRLDRPSKTYVIKSQTMEVEDGSKTSVGFIEWGPDIDLSQEQIDSGGKSESKKVTGQEAEILTFIKGEFAEHGMVVTTQEVSSAFPDMAAGSVRMGLSRLVGKEKLERTTNGCYKPL